MHVKAIKMPRVENALLLSDIKAKVKGNVGYTKASFAPFSTVSLAGFYPQTSKASSLFL